MTETMRIVVTAGALVAAAGVGWLVHRLVLRSLIAIGERMETPTGDALLRHCSAPSRYLLPVLAANLVLPALPLSAAAAAGLGRTLLVVLTGLLAWLVIGLLRASSDLILDRFDVGVPDNLRARKVHTQIEVVRKILSVLVIVLAVAAVFLYFERLRRLGTGILASAGLAGLVLGFAAQRTLSNLIAGFQLALTQPIRIDDVLVVEGEWGWVEEITLTYVVLRVWDRRRLVLPIVYFLEQPFQNWTRTSASILGTVYVRTDYTVPVDAVRKKVGELVESSEHWDGEVWRLHVTDSGERTVELRALMSAEDSPSAWELRCEVREELIRWLQSEYPEALPRMRAELDADEEGSPSSAGGPRPAP